MQPGPRQALTGAGCCKHFICMHSVTTSCTRTQPGPQACADRCVGRCQLLQALCLHAQRHDKLIAHETWPHPHAQQRSQHDHWLTTAVSCVQALQHSQASTFMMVAPTAFTFNEQAAQDNKFMHSSAASTDAGPHTTAVDSSGPGAAAAAEVSRRVLQEHKGLYQQLAQVLCLLHIVMHIT